MSNPRIIVPLDFPDAQSALALCQQLSPELCRLKIGKELFTSSGPMLLEQLQNQGYDIFLDLKYHDIPNTVAKACAAASSLGVWMLNVHASGGITMLSAAREAVDKCSHQPLLIAVTVLTSMNQGDMASVGINRSIDEQVSHLAGLTKEAGLDGVVCSAQEANQLKNENGKDFCLVTPGIRPASASQHDQKRIMTPGEAITAGSHYLVIGRPITKASDPLAALEDIQTEINNTI
ncbi:MAG: orotidine-5'-phosphate decarboxylase [Pseudomonadota bacterium]